MANRHKDDAYWENLWDADLVSPDAAYAKIQQTAERIYVATHGHASAIMWSGGKDSEVLRLCAWAAGVRHAICMHSMWEHVEVDEWLRRLQPRWPELTVNVSNKLTLEYLIQHPDMIFPSTNASWQKWANNLQRWGSRDWAIANDIEILLTGRRWTDGNSIPKGGMEQIKNGLVYYHPIADWTDPEILAAMRYHGGWWYPLYVNNYEGWVLGTGPYLLADGTMGLENCWATVHQHSPRTVQRDAPLWQSAQDFLAKRRTNAKLLRDSTPIPGWLTTKLTPAQLHA